MIRLAIDCVLFAALVLSTWLVVEALAAPLPRPKAVPRPDPCGNWVALWSGSEWPTVLLPCGGYVAERPGGPRYEGRWKLEGDTLHLEERLAGPTGYGEATRYKWALLPGKLEAASGAFKLRRAMP